MVSYVNVHAILDGRRACAKGSATNVGSSQVVFLLIKSTLKFFLCISLVNILGFCHETSKPSRYICIFINLACVLLGSFGNFM